MHFDSFMNGCDNYTSALIGVVTLDVTLVYVEYTTGLLDAEIEIIFMPRQLFHGFPPTTLCHLALSLFCAETDKVLRYCEVDKQIRPRTCERHALCDNCWDECGGGVYGKLYADLSLSFPFTRLGDSD